MVRRSEKIAIAIGMVGASFTLLAYKQTLMTTTHSILLGFVISIIALGIKEFDLMEPEIVEKNDVKKD
jgi:hypothetical protein